MLVTFDEAKMFSMMISTSDSKEYRAKQKLFLLTEKLGRAGVDPNQSYLEYDENALSMFGEEDCVITVSNGGLLLRQFNPFRDQEIICHFEEPLPIEGTDMVILRDLFA